MLRRGLLMMGCLALWLGGCAAPANDSADEIGEDGVPAGAAGQGAEEDVAVVSQALGGGCAKFNYDGHEYSFCEGSKDWSAARTYCQSIGSDLVRIDSPAENAFVLSKVSCNSWMGANDRTTEGTWKWTAGNDTLWSGGATKPGFYTNWAFTEPNNLFNEDCGLFYDDGQWNDTLCNITAGWVCEKANDLCPNDPAKTQPGTCGCGTPDLDPDGDGVASCVDECPLDAASATAGSCGCPSSPVAAGTTCSNSVCGGVSTCNGAGMCGNPSSCKPEASCTLARRGGSVYWLCPTKLDASTARQRCQAKGMDLAIVDDAGEDAFLTSRTGLDGMWLGARKTTSSKWEWQATRKQFWSNGAPANNAHTGWAPLHPDLAFGDCAYIDGWSWQWQVELCSLKHAYACERSTDWFFVDPTVVPNPTRDMDDVTGEERIIGRIVDEDGEVSQLIESEIMLETSSPTTLNTFLQTYGGTVIDTMEFEADPQDDLQNIYQIKLDPARLAQASTISTNFALIDPNDPGVFRASTTNTLRTLATFAEATVNGYKVELNWAATNEGDVETLSVQNVLDARVVDRPVGAFDHVGSFTPDNPFGYNHFSDFATQHIGVGEAWQSLARTGKLVRNVDMAVFDSGFPSPETLASHGGHDYPDQTRWLKAGPLIDQYRDSRFDDDKGWHGLKCAYAAWGKANNGIGGAGPGYPVVRNAYNGTWGGAIWTWKRMVYMLRWLYRNHGNDNVIVSISQSVSLRTKMMTMRFNVAVRRFERSGMLILGSAGNQHMDVDKMGTFGVRERRHTVPCELTGVFCVGGIVRNGFDREHQSNWGNSDVDIFAPFEVWVGPTPDEGEGWFPGTSAATPFVAGIAALVWAADPDLSSDEVKSVLRQTATVVNNASHVTRVVDANAAVDRVLNGFGPTLDIASPAHNSTLDYRFAITGKLTSFDAGLGAPTVVWRNNNVVVGNGPTPTFDYNAFAVGNNTLHVRATYSNGTVLEDAVTVVRQVPDSLRVVRPVDGQCIGQGRNFFMESLPADPNVGWNWNGVPFATGQNLSVGTAGVAFGTYNLGATLNDGITTRTGTSTVRIVDPSLVANVTLDLVPVADVIVPRNVGFVANLSWDSNGDGTLDCSTTSGCTPPFPVQFVVTNQAGNLVGSSTGGAIPINAIGSYFVEAFIVADLPTGERCVIAADGQAFAGGTIPL